MNIIEVKNITFQYDENSLFQDFSLVIRNHDWLTIAGSCGSGKSTLLRLLVGLLEEQGGQIIVDGIRKERSHLRDIRKKIGIVFENPDYQFVADTVFDDIAFSLENMLLSKLEIQNKVNQIAEQFGITELLRKSPHELSGGQKQMVALASALVIEPKVLLLDEAFTMIDPVTKETIFKLLTKLKKARPFTIINVTHDMEESLYGKHILLLDRGEIVLYDKNKIIYQEERIIRKLGLDLPFMADLSLKLKYYGLVEDIELKMDKLVNQIWK